MIRTLNVIPGMEAWAKANEPALRCADAVLPKPIRGPKNYIDCDEFDRQALKALDGVCFPVGCPEKRFARHMVHANRMTKAQRQFAYRIVHRFRRQLPADLVKEAESRIEVMNTLDATPLPLTLFQKQNRQWCLLQAYVRATTGRTGKDSHHASDTQHSAFSILPSSHLRLCLLAHSPGRSRAADCADSHPRLQRRRHPDRRGDR